MTLERHSHKSERHTGEIRRKLGMIMADMSSGISIVGAGALGQAFAAHLAAAGTSVVLLATPRATASLRSTGRIRLCGATELEVPVVSLPARLGAVAVTDDPGALPTSQGSGVPG